MKIRKIIICLLILLLTNTCFSMTRTQAFSISEIKDSAQSFLDASTDADVDNTIDSDQLRKTNSAIYNVLLGIGIVVAVVVGAFLGIQFIFGSVEGKAKILETLVPYVVGCIVVFGAFTIWKVAVNIGNDIDDTTKSSATGVATGGITWQQAANAKDYIDNGGDLTTVPNDTLVQWYGQLSRQSGNNGRLTAYYNKVRAEISRRGIY